MPKPNTLIQIEGSTYREIRKAILDWIDSYTKQLDTDFKIELVQYGKNSFDIIVDNRIETMLFFYLTNYLRFPIGMTYEADIKGFIRIKESTELIKSLNGQQVVVFINDADTAFDNVHIVNIQNQIWKVDFNQKVESAVLDYDFTTPIKRENQALKKEVLKVEQKRALKKEGRLEQHQFRFRFPIIAGIYSILLAGYLFYQRSGGSIEFIEILLFTFPVLWAYMEQDAIKFKEAFYKLLGFLSILLGLVVYIKFRFYNHTDFLLLIGTLAGLGFLLAQMILRYFFLKLFEHEAKLFDDYEIRKFSIEMLDLAYSILLFILAGFITWGGYMGVEYFLNSMN